MLNINNQNLCEYCFEQLPGKTKSCPCCPGEHNITKYPTALPEKTILVGRYSVGKVLGKGGFGITYLCYDLKEGKKVAIKEYFPDTLAHRNTGETAVTSYDDARLESFRIGAEKFYEEAKMVARFNGNPNIISVYEFFYENNTAYFVMEYLSGTDMKGYLEQHGGRISESEVLYIAKRAIEALMIIHSTGVLHRDISPDNIFICDNGDVKLIDFGAARQVIADASNSLSVILKHGFAPIEQYQRKGKQGAWTDIYALGASMYYSITGKLPDDAMSRLEEPALDFSGVSPKFAAVIDRMLAVKADDRYRTVFEVLNDLNATGIAETSLHISPEVKKSFCEKCGVEVPAGDTLCENCRNPVVVPKPSDNASRPDLNKKLAAACAILAVIGIVIVLSVIIRNDTVNTYNDDTSNYDAIMNNNVDTTGGAGKKVIETGIGNVEGDLDALIPEEISLTLDKTELSLTEGETFILTAKVESNKDKEYEVEWSSNDKKVAIIDSDGEIVAMGVGTTTITASVGEKEVSCTVTVNRKSIEASGITLSEDEVVLKLNGSIELKATVIPSDADDRTVTWTSTREEIATVRNGKVTAVAPGTATVSARTANGKTASCTVKVAGITKVNVTENSVSLEAGKTYTFEGITISGIETNSLSDSEKTVTLSSSDSSVVSVNGHTITGRKAGTATISFTTAGGAKDECKVTVKEAAVKGISLNKTSTTLEVGMTETLTATVTPSNASSKTVTWSSSNTNVAKVNNGKITAVSKGTATITAKAGNVTAKCTVTVNPAAKIIESGKCGTNVSYTLDENGILRISGKGSMTNYSNNNAPWYQSRSKIFSVIIEDGVTHIGNFAFQNCVRLTSITIPSSVTSIGDFAFFNCCRLTNITIPDSVTSIGIDAFSYCTSLTSITIPSRVTSIDNCTFYECQSLTSITIPDSVTSIGLSAFNSCYSLTNITIPDNVTRIGEYAFANCTSIKSITIPSSVTSIGRWDAFYGWTSDQTIYVTQEGYGQIMSGEWDLGGNATVKVYWP